MNELLQKGNSLLGGRHNAGVPRGTINKGLAQSLTALSMSALFAMPAVAAVGPFAFVADSAVRIIDLRSNQTFPNTEVPLDTVAAFSLNKAGTKLYELYSMDGGIGVRDIATNKYGSPIVKKGVLSVVAPTTGGGMALTPDDAYLLVATGSELDVISVETGTIVKRIDKTLNVINPVDVKMSPSGLQAYVSDQCGGVAVISLANWSVVKTIDLAPSYLNSYIVANKCQSAVRPASLDVHPGGAVAYVLDTASGAVSKVDVGTGAITSVTVGGSPRRIVVNADGSKAYISFSDLPRVAVVDLKTFSAASPIQADAPAVDLAAYRDGTVYGAFDKQSNGEYWLSAIDASTGTLTKKVQLVPSIKRLFVGDLSTDLATLFNPSSANSGTSPSASSQPSTSDGGGGGGGCSMGRVTGGVDPVLPFLALGALVFLGIRRRAKTGAEA